MTEMLSEAQEMFDQLAERMIQRYARGLLTVDWLAAQLVQQSQRDGFSEIESDWHAVEILAQTLCSQTLCEGCLSSEAGVCNLAFENLERYLAETLTYSSAAAGLRAQGLDCEVLQLTLLEIWSTFQRRGAGPERPAAFLKWAKVILFRQLSHYLGQLQHSVWLSLETQPEPVLEALVDLSDVDPLDTVVQEEERKELKEAILALKNRQYQEVLLSTLFAGLEERELAARWQVRVQDIYLWRCRALKALRKHKLLTRG
jgi:DNA-directed RNA polymerase specialized sigma24 family protein